MYASPNTRPEVAGSDEDASRLSEVLLAGLDAQGLRPGVDREALDARLHALWWRGRARWPEIDLPAKVFVAYLARRLDGDDLQLALGQLAATDLYLACACGRGDRAALRCFEAELMPQVEKALCTFSLDPVRCDEIRQAVRLKLFMAESDPSGIGGYAGRGPLAGWLRVVAVRTALGEIRKERRHRAVAVELPELLPAEDLDPELRYLKAAYRREFSRALTEAVASISDHERTLLALSLVDRLDAGRIAPLYGVHRTTMMRWLARLRDKLFRRTMSGIATALRVDPAQARSIARLVQSSIQVSLTRHLEQERGRTPRQRAAGA